MPRKNKLINKKCLLCGKKQKIQVLHPATFKPGKLSSKLYSARRSPDRIHFQIVKCQRCGLVFSSPILPFSSIAKLYRQSTCNYSEQIIHTTKTYLKLFRQARKHLPKNPKVLDVGCGNGFFLKALRGLGIKNVWGVEPGEKMVKEALPGLRRRIKIGLFNGNMFKSGSFDAVCCFHTLDHMINPVNFVKTVYKLLKPGGVVLLVVHDAKGLSVKLFGERSPIFDIEHIYLFNKQTLRSLFERRQFSSAEVFNLVNTYPLGYWLKMSGLPTRVKKVISIGLGFLNLENISLSLKGGNIAMIAKKG